LALVGSEEGILGNVFVAFKLNFFFADLGNVGSDFRTEFFFQPFFGDGSGGNAGCGFTGGASAATAVIARAVFVPVSIVGMTGTEAGGDVAVVFTALVGIAD